MLKSIKNILAFANNILDKDNESDAEILLAFLLDKKREYLFSHGEERIDDNLCKKYEELIKRRASGEPVAYITGHKEFFGLDFEVNKNVLIPRPETEIVVEKALSILNKKLRSLVGTSVGTKNILCIDIGTGSGCIIISLAKKIINSPLLNPCHSRENGNPEKKEICKTKLDSRLCGNDNTIEKNIKFIGLDVSDSALKTARQNARRHKLDKKIKFVKSNFLEELLNKNYSLLTTRYSLVLLANLPYVPSKYLKKLGLPENTGLKYEPQSALNGGSDGLDFYRKLSIQIKEINKINPNITLLCEIGSDQSEEMEKIFSFMKNKKIKRDLAGLDRVFIARN